MTDERLAWVRNWLEGWAKTPPTNKYPDMPREVAVKMGMELLEALDEAMRVPRVPSTARILIALLIAFAVGIFVGADFGAAWG